MKEFLKRVGRGILRFFTVFWYVWLAAIVGVIVSLITKNTNVGTITFFSIIAAFIAFIWLRQVWWWITKTGDYSIQKKDEEDSNTEG